MAGPKSTVFFGIVSLLLFAWSMYNLSHLFKASKVWHNLMSYFIAIVINYAVPALIIFLVMNNREKLGIDDTDRDKLLHLYIRHHYENKYIIFNQYYYAIEYCDTPKDETERLELQDRVWKKMLRMIMVSAVIWINYFIVDLLSRYFYRWISRIPYLVTIGIFYHHIWFELPYTILMNLGSAISQPNEPPAPYARNRIPANENARARRRGGNDLDRYTIRNQEKFMMVKASTFMLILMLSNFSARICSLVVYWIIEWKHTA